MTKEQKASWIKYGISTILIPILVFVGGFFSGYFQQIDENKTEVLLLKAELNHIIDQNAKLDKKVEELTKLLLEGN